jgi:hypothetical protein
VVWPVRGRKDITEVLVRRDRPVQLPLKTGANIAKAPP